MVRILLLAALQRADETPAIFHIQFLDVDHPVVGILDEILEKTQSRIQPLQIRRTLAFLRQRR